MGFDIFAAIMAVLSVLSFGAIGGADITDDQVIIDVPSGTTGLLAGQETSSGSSPATPPETNSNPLPATPAEQPGASLIAGTWEGTKSIPFVASLSCRAVISADGTAQFSGDVTSSMFGDHTFSVPVSWEYLGGSSFNTIIEGTDTKITCDGTKLTFPANPYRLGLVDNEMADQNFSIELRRV